ncbi:MAG: restriction endonuclease subunit S [Geothrix sp.]|uniref:restriction endonuclease subunit S n=1 Tax=Geothrix sp. TaxID=1962974 RepID=UPI003BB13858
MSAKGAAVKEKGDLPSGWKLMRLGDLAKTSSGGTPRRDKPQYYGGTIPWVKSGELGDRVIFETSEALTEAGLASSNAKIFPKGTLCIALYGATVGKLGILGIDAATNQAVCAVFPPSEIDTRFLYRFFEGKRRELIEQGKGGAQSNISQGIIRDTIIPVPPLDEQRQVVAEIEKQFTRLEVGVAALRRVQANLKRYRAAVLKAACEGRLVPTEAELARTGKGNGGFESGDALLTRILTERHFNWNGRGKCNVAAMPDATNPPKLPSGWTWASVEQLGDVKLGRQRSPKNVSKNYPTKYIRAANITERGIDVSDVLEMEFSPAERERFVLKDGDIVLSEASGSPSQVGKPAIWRDELPLCCFQNTVIRLRPVIVESKYVLVVFQHFYANSVFATVAGGVGINHLGAEKFSAIQFPLPPLAEQTRIVAEVERRLSVMEELESMVSANLQRAAGLRQSILHKAFSGQLICAAVRP